MTPYATLLVKPTDTDEVIRKTYHAIAREEHPDLTGMAVTERWQLTTAAYTAIKNADARFSWAKKQELLSGLCTTCEGSGVRGTRMFKSKIKLCSECEGEGRC